MSAIKRHYKCSIVGCTKEHRTLHRLPLSKMLRTQWLNFIFEGSNAEKKGKALYVCANHFTPDCFTNEGQFNAGFSLRLILKEGSIPTIRAQTSAPDETNMQQTPAVADDQNITTENDFGEATGCRDEVSDFSNRDSVDTASEEILIGGLDLILDWPSTEIDSSEQDRDSDAGLPQRKRPRLSSTSAPSEEGNKGNGRESQSSPDASSGISTMKWLSSGEANDKPLQPVFTPVQTPGLKFESSSCNNPLMFFKRFFSKHLLQEVALQTNVYAKTYQKRGTQWDKISRKELDLFMALVIFMGLFKCSSLQDYWRESEYFGLHFPGRIMSYQRFLAISKVLHLSDIHEDEENKKKKGTPNYERLGKIQPLYQSIREACKTFFHPFQNITITERMVTSQAALRKCTKNKYTNNGYKLFALSDCTTGYTWDFFIYEGKSCASQSHGLSYESVMALVDDNLLGTGYKLFVDKFYTSPTLFRDLLHKDVWACGPFWPNRKGFPNPNVNSLPKNAPSGTIRWIRDNKLLFVHWKDAQEVQICSTFHKAYRGNTVQRKVKRDDGTWTLAEIPIPAAVLDYDRNMETVDSSNWVSEHFRLIHKPRKWYQCVFYHFLDIAVENAFILQELTAKAKNKMPMNRRAFLEILILRLIAGAPVPSTHASAPTSMTGTPALSSATILPSASFHKPKHITQDSTVGEQKCHLCHQDTTVMCVTCNVMLCLHLQRDCFNDWHEKQGL